MVDADLIVIGAGPVGMAAALLADIQGLDVLVLEAAPLRHRQSRAVGVTPPSLEILQQAGVSERLVAAGVPVRRARFRNDGRPVGTIDFSGLEGRYPFVLAIPQHRTEEILEGALKTAPHVRLMRGHEVRDLQPEAQTVTVTGSGGPGGHFTFTGHCAIACDGVRSAARSSLKIPFRGERNPQCFVMGDFAGFHDWGDEARFFLPAAVRWSRSRSRTTAGVSCCAPPPTSPVRRKTTSAAGSQPGPGWTSPGCRWSGRVPSGSSTSWQRSSPGAGSFWPATRPMSCRRWGGRT